MFQLVSRRIYTERLLLLESREKSYGYRMFTRSSKRSAFARVFWIHLPEVCWIV